MTNLSPAAQAVLDAAMQYEINPECCSREIAAAVLRAAADQVASPIPDDCTADVFNRQLEIRHKLLSIATEMEGAND